MHYHKAANLGCLTCTLVKTYFCHHCIYLFLPFKLSNEEAIKKAYSELEWVVFIS